ncbi:MAG: NAD(P)-dependent oxidoreductase [Cyclobacteriaceae bacterium]
MKIGLIKEGKIPLDKRVPFSPKQLFQLQNYYDQKVAFKVFPSDIRCFSNEEYESLGIELSEDLSDCEVLMGVKEVPLLDLLADKTYFFFSHTIKKQSYNKTLLQVLLKKNIRLIDYEVLLMPEGKRAVAFGRWAGIVGAYNALWTYGKKSGLYKIKRAYQCHGMKEILEEIQKVMLPPIKLVITGDGKVGSGALEIMNALGIRKVEPEAYLQNYYEEPVFTQLTVSDYNQRKTDGGFLLEDFFSKPEKYEGCFLPYTEVSDILITAAFWDPRAPQLFNIKDIGSPEFNISVIADITCDLEGFVPITVRPSTIEDPVYDIDRDTFEEIPAFGKQNSISVMAIDNLPCELPRDASEDFGMQLTKNVIPELLSKNSEMISRATISEGGALTQNFKYLQDFINEG